MSAMINYSNSAGAAESTAEKARAFGVKAITVNCLAHGGVKTDMWERPQLNIFLDKICLSEEVDKAVGIWSPFNRSWLP